MAVAATGPITVAIDTGNASFQSDKSGIHYNPAQSSKDLGHDVLWLVTAEGANSKGGNYLLVNSSQGPEWGSKGCIKTAKDKN